MVLIIGDEGIISEGALGVIGDNVVKGSGNFEGVIETGVAHSTVMDRDCEFNLAWTFFSFDNPIKTD